MSGSQSVPPAGGGTNELIPMVAGQGAGATAVGPVAHPDLATHHANVAAAFEKTGDAMQRLERIEASLLRLVRMGDAVTPEDVVETAGKLVASGEDPLQLASVLADMPQGPGALPGWLQQRQAAIAAAKQQVAPVHEAMRHALGVSSLHVLASMAMHPAASAPAMHPAAPRNQLDLASAAPVGNA